MGQFWHVQLPISGQDSGNQTVDFYVCNYTPELLLFYTASTDWEYERSLRIFIEETIGLGRMWIGPKTFENLILFFVDRYQPSIERFFARRNKWDNFPSKIKRDVKRRVDWGAEDSFETMFELRDQYGIRPTAVLMRFKDGKIQLNNDGVFVLTRINTKMFEAFEAALNFIGKEESFLTTASQRVELHLEKVGTEGRELVVPQLISGAISLKRAKLADVIVNRIMQGEKFDFIDSATHEGSFSWVATAIDKDKKSVFGVNSNESVIHLIPQFQVTFESFLDFYREILEEIDSTASFQTLGGIIG
ncbi:MAG: hypothetical protein HYU39_09245 [Thaumarchaeota archaeon]|nr:hypothetical protein [Nitrososphaerota archaeon]